MSESAPCQDADGSTDNSDKDSSVKCPTCGRDDFLNEKGLNVHRAHIHDWSSKKEIECQRCGEVFKAATDKRKYCSKDCSAEAHSIKYSGENAPHYAGGGIDKVCEICGDEFNVRQSREDTARFCSHSCRATWFSKEFQGENHHAYNGYEQYYGPNWDEQREKARKRDDYTCQSCGLKEEHHYQELDVHHIKPIRHFKDKYESPEWYERGNKLSNLVTLCRENGCHPKWDKLPLRPKLLD